MKTIKLPNKPSKLIRIALSDLYAIEKDKRYTIEMGRWHEPTVDAEGQPICAVCLAGSVMARRGHCNTTTSIHLWKIPKANRNQMCAINCFRNGEVEDGLDALGIEMPEKGVNDFEYVTPYSSSPGQFKRDMRKLATKLERVGL